MKKLSIALALASLAFLTNGCFLAKKMAGADIDGESFAKAREAKIYSSRLAELEKLKAKSPRFAELQKSDFTLYLNESLLNKIAKQYVGQSGWLDESTSYSITGVNLSVKNGGAFANLSLLAKNTKFNVDVDLIMDCLLLIVEENGELRIKIEPFNISPNVSTGILLSGTSEIIGNLIKLNLAKMGETMPKIAIPMSVDNNFSITGSTTNINDKIKMAINNPNRYLNYKLKILDVLFFEGRAMVAINFESAEAK